MCLIRKLIDLFKKSNTNTDGNNNAVGTESKPEQPEVNGFVTPKMTLSVFAVMTSSEDIETKNRFWQEMGEHEALGEFVYTLYSNTWEYNISNGQFIAILIHAKEFVCNTNIPKMTKDVFNVMTSSESAETKARLWREMVEHEASAKFVYTLYSDTWEYYIRNGQFIAIPIHEKGNIMTSYTPKMSISTFNIMTSSENVETKARVWEEMCVNEQKGIFEYIIKTDAWEYHINNGQFTANPLHN